MTTSPVHVTIDDRKFLVTFEGDEPRLIKERKTYRPGTPYAALYDAPYWHWNHHKLGKSWTLPARIIEAARAKR